MELLFLGTGAADWKIENRDTLLETRGDFRRYSSALIDGVLLIDPGPHIYDFCEKNGTPDLLSKVRYVLVTHSHDDHFYPETIERLSKETGCKLYADRGAKKVLEKSCEDLSWLDFTEIGVTEKFGVGPYTVTSFHANHSTAIPDECARNYAIRDNAGKYLFYGLDSGPFRIETWQRLKKFSFDCLILECTTGDVLGDERIYGHSSLPWVLYSYNTLKAKGLLKENARTYISHMALTLTPPQKELEQRLEETGTGIIAAYDGMKISF